MFRRRLSARIVRLDWPTKSVVSVAVPLEGALLEGLKGYVQLQRRAVRVVLTPAHVQLGCCMRWIESLVCCLISGKSPEDQEITKKLFKEGRRYPRTRCTRR